MTTESSEPKSFAVFPFLKTSGPIHIGKFSFQSTGDATGLTNDQRESVRLIKEMVFWRDDLRLKSSAFAIVPLVDPDKPDPSTLSDLAAVQTIIAYMYGEPHEVFGDPFLSSEHATLLILTRGPVLRALACPDHDVEFVAPRPASDPAAGSHVEGFHGIYNVRDHFWATKGARIQGPLPHMTLNGSQDLARDLPGISHDLMRVVSHPATAPSERLLRAMQWFNDSNAATNDDSAAIVDLAIAFETLLGIPAVESKTDRFVDAISLLLGRAARVDVWARQFYNARSNVAHEGRAHQLRFAATDASKPPKDAQLYHSLLAVGRQVFRLCLRTIAMGASLAERAGLEEKLVTNRERFERVCKVLADTGVDAAVRLNRAASTVQAILCGRDRTHDAGRTRSCSSRSPGRVGTRVRSAGCPGRRSSSIR
jgi:hypothetical protein